MRIVFFLLIFFLLIFIPALGLAEELYVTPTGAGSEDGSSWSNAFAGFSDITWGSGSGNLGAGDTLYVSGGASGLTYTEELTIGANGSDGSLIYIKTGALSPSPSGHDGLVTITSSGAGIKIGSYDYIVIDGDDGAGNRNFKMLNNTNPGVHINGGTDNLIRYVEATGNEDGIKIEGIDNACHSRGDPYSTNIFEHCYVYDNDSDGIVAPKCVTGRYSIIQSTHASHKDGWEAYGGSGHGHIMVFGNDFVGSGANYQFFGRPLDAMGPDYFINNIFRCDTDTAACTLERGIGVLPDKGDGFEVYVWNNTFAYILYRPPIRFIGPGEFDVIDIRNNIVYDSCASGGGQAILIGSDVGNPTITIDYNIIYAPEYGCTSISVKGTSYPCSKGSYSTYNKNGNCNAVSLVNPVYGQAGDLHLSSSDTNARDGGVDLSAYFTTDKDGNSRGQGSAWDIGAYEYHEDGEDAQAPAPPKNIKILE
ncbi:MAG: choice-of-anchor Q domain-containing protein [Candidatus Hodarchaeota archaeon]